MDYYYLKYYPDEVGKKSEVHREGCPRLNEASHTVYVGYYSSCRDAIDHAKRIYPYIADLCSECCPEFKGLP
ncbi:hypothetical protein JS578_02915 [Dysgonomonadaceae bacterium zrk40]|nr:hypothetical protein JS578_02915 [Dysgonomonadaceae bacterium zrk40]